MRGKILPALALALLLLLSACAQVPPQQSPQTPQDTREDYIGIEAAKSAALAHAQLAEADFTTAGLDRREGQDFYAVTFTAGLTSYQYEIDPVSGAVLSAVQTPAEISLSPIGQEEAREIALTRAGLTEQEVIFTEIELDTEDGRQIYQLEFRTAAGAEYECEVAVLTGELTYFECDYEHVLPLPAPGGALIGQEEARSIALDHAGYTREETIFAELDGILELDWDDGRHLYEAKFSAPNGRYYQYDIDAVTGEIVKYSEELPPFYPGALPPGPDEPIPYSGPLTADEAKAIALAQVPGASGIHIHDFDYDYDDDDGRLKYEVEIRYNGMEYEFEIDSTTGAILKMESEPID